MVDKEVAFVLGARDPEMREIEKTLAADGRAYFHAAKDRLAVNPRSAYEADGVVHLSRSGRSSEALLPPQTPTAVVECLLAGRAPLVRVDRRRRISGSLSRRRSGRAPPPARVVARARDRTLPPDLAEGAAYAGLAVRYRDWMREGALKEMLKGAQPAHIERFMREHRDAGREVYGNPWRGYAGAYLE
ncbi:MAG: hypothetical protein ACT4P4_15455 [Betaproteobacteria bacterium]